MKKNNLYLLFIVVLILFLTANALVQGQPPVPAGGHGLNGNQGSGGAAPLDGGSLILLLGSLGYGAFKVIVANYRKKDDN